MKRCPCCGHLTIDDSYEIITDICEVCFWQYDEVAQDAPDISIGPNKISLNMAKKNYRDRLKVTKLIDSSYEIKEIAGKDDAIYCEIQYQRDRSSFAGMAFRITDNKGVVIVEECEERLIKNIGSYEKLYAGYVQEYINAVRNIFSLGRKEYGMEILFLIYSDVRSSQIIFEELIKCIDKNIDLLR